MRRIWGIPTKHPDKLIITPETLPEKKGGGRGHFATVLRDPQRSHLPQTDCFRMWYTVGVDPPIGHCVCPLA
ncbi:MAG: hypothetical protein KAX19_08665, partial [Candidatus Brocadiae bacterium]|nr:hypothetical protein [Candidatus Brocadiia bacterium]